MKLSRRRFLHLVSGVAAMPAISRKAFAQAYPTRPVRIVVGFVPGGTADMIARLMGRWLSERLDHPFVVENRPGAASNIAAEAVARAPPDGHTLLWITSTNAISATIYKKPGFDFIRDIVPIASVIRAPFVMEVNPSLPVKTVPEFIAYAKAHPAKINFGSGGHGSSTHVPAELFKMMTGVNMVHVPYRGSGSALSNLLGGQIQVTFDVLASSIEYIRTGRLRALAVTTASRSEALPEVPSLSDFVPGYEASTWTGLGAPKNTPTEIIDRLNSEVNAGLADAKIKTLLADQGGTTFPGSSADFRDYIVEETERLGKVVAYAGIKPE